MAKNKKKQHSITTQITLTIVGLVAGTVLLCWLLNVTLLEGYYTRYKQEVLENGFQQINAASEQGILNTSDYDIDFEKICSNGNLTILIITSDGTVVRSSTNGVENLRMQFMEIIVYSMCIIGILSFFVSDSFNRNIYVCLLYTSPSPRD